MSARLSWLKFYRKMLRGKKSRDTTSFTALVIKTKKKHGPRRAEGEQMKEKLKEGNVKTYWNGEPCDAEIVRVVVGKSPKPTWWCAGLEGTERSAVRVTQNGYSFYLDNEDGSGWFKVTEGLGSPTCGHKALPVEREAKS